MKAIFLIFVYFISLSLTALDQPRQQHHCTDLILEVAQNLIKKLIEENTFPSDTAYLKEHTPEEVLYNSAQLNPGMISYFRIIDPLHPATKIGFAFIRELIKEFTARKVDPVELIPHLFEFFPKVVKTSIDIADVLHMYDVIENLRSQGFRRNDLGGAGIEILGSLQNWKARELDYTIELTISTDFLLMIKTLYVDLDFALHICDYIYKSTTIETAYVRPLLLLYLSMLRFPVDPQKDFVPSRLGELLLNSKNSKPCVLSNLEMALLFQCRAKAYLERLHQLEKFYSQTPLLNNFSCVIPLVPKPILLFFWHCWQNMPEGLPCDIWLLILQQFNLSHMEIEKLEQRKYLSL